VRGTSEAGIVLFWEDRFTGILRVLHDTKPIHKPDTAGVVEPREEAFDFPSSADTAQRAAILCAGADSTIRGDYLDPVGAHERVIKRVAVVAAVADQSGGEIGEEAASTYRTTC
jgi:hypothetical protein